MSSDSYLATTIDKFPVFDPGLQRPCNYLQGVFHTQQVFGAVAGEFLIVLVAEYGLARLGPFYF